LSAGSISTSTVSGTMESLPRVADEGLLPPAV
jgi:hypothetical protein